MWRKHRHRLELIAHVLTTGGRTMLLFRCPDPAGPDCYQSKAIAGRWTDADFDSRRLDTDN